MSKFKLKFPRARTFEHFRARSRLYRSQILQVNARWKALDEIYKIYNELGSRLKALAEIYKMHTFAPISIFKKQK